VFPVKPLAQAMPVLLVSPVLMDYVKLKHWPSQKSPLTLGKPSASKILPSSSWEDQEICDSLVTFFVAYHKRIKQPAVESEYQHLDVTVAWYESTNLKTIFSRTGLYFIVGRRVAVQRTARTTCLLLW
jgi:hypothetical protein